MEQVTIRYSDYSEYSQVYRLHWKQQRAYQTSRVIAFICFLVLVLLIFIGKANFFVWFFAVITLIHWIGLLLTLSAGLSFNQNAPTDREVQLEFYPDRIFFKHALAEGSIYWLEKVTITPQTILITVNQHSSVLLTKAHTQDDEQFSRIAELVQQIPQGKDQRPHVNQ